MEFRSNRFLDKFKKSGSDVKMNDDGKCRGKWQVYSANDIEFINSNWKNIFKYSKTIFMF